jgi:D-3-phosphoglycerate dehydrogenase
VLTALLEASRPDGQVNIVNAPAIATQLGLDVTESTINAKTEFNELVVAELKKGETRYRVAGTIIGQSPRIVEIDKLYVDCNIAGKFLFVHNDDRPGIVGVIGTALGNAAVNIANMGLARTADRTRALTVIEVDSEPPAALLEQLKSTPGIIKVITVEL